MIHFEELLILPLLTAIMIYGEYRFGLAEAISRSKAIKVACLWGGMYFICGTVYYLTIKESVS